MTRQPNPFSLYDFLGYFTPGAAAIYGIFYFLNTHYHSDQVTEYLTLKLFKLVSLGEPFSYVRFVIASYILGHLLSFFSSITVEKYGICQYGYPSKFLLNFREKRYFFERIKLTSRFDFWVILNGLFLLPVVACDLVLGEAGGVNRVYKRELDSILINPIIKTKNELIQSLRIEDGERQDFFRYLYHYAVEHAPNHFPKMQNYVALYGFLRTLTLVLVLAFWLFLWWAIFVACLSPAYIVSISLILTFLCYLFFMAFMKFYRRFSLEALMAATVVFYHPIAAVKD